MIRIALGALLGGALVLAFYERDALRLQWNAAPAAEPGAIEQTIELALNEPYVNGRGDTGEPSLATAERDIVERDPDVAEAAPSAASAPTGEAMPNGRPEANGQPEPDGETEMRAGPEEAPTIYVYSPRPVRDPGPPQSTPSPETGTASAARESGDRGSAAPLAAMTGPPRRQEPAGAPESDGETWGDPEVWDDGFAAEPADADMTGDTLDPPTPDGSDGGGEPTTAAERGALVRRLLALSERLGREAP